MSRVAVPTCRVIRFGAQFMDGGDPRGCATYFTPVDFARAAEEVGFDSVWTGDHVLHHVDGLASIAAMAGATSRIEVGTNVIVLPLRPAAVVAKSSLTTALVARGRLTWLGVGVGGDVPNDFAVTGAELSTRGAYTDEALLVIRELWSGESVSFNGRWSNFDSVTVRDIPARLPRIVVGGRSEAAIQRAARYGDGLIPYLVSPRRAGEMFAALRSEASSLGRPGEELTCAVTTFMVGASSAEEAASLIGQAGGGNFSGVTAEILSRTHVLGTDEECTAKILEYVEAGADHIVLGAQRGHPDVLESFMTQAQRLLPVFRSRFAGCL
jgi:alkanesulfonate monooxygenase SsuD/methylene tetrahydromethanopterin reductase-like flavin-dependent oxidoreductase (luciferase family)